MSFNWNWRELANKLKSPHVGPFSVDQYNQQVWESYEKYILFIQQWHTHHLGNDLTWDTVTAKSEKI